MTTEDKSQLRVAGEFAGYLIQHPGLMLLLLAAALMWLSTLPQRLVEHGWVALNPKTAIKRYHQRSGDVVDDTATDWIDQMWIDDRRG